MKFEIGEIARFIGDPQRHKFPPCDVEIISDGYIYHSQYDGNRFGYDVMVEGCKSNAPDSVNGEYFVGAEFLRKKQPPAENQDITETKEKGGNDWDLIPWRPEKELIK